ncbi:hypothetical protein [Tabrizicola sp. BL-A-41-H6]|uniref:hypothetical protein n=1 Tax=Tabrizicola sp. BL-A-41-H6 TaxID=3421107 RepID=UPI003D67D0DD
MPILEALGWDLHDVEEVRSEYRHASADNPVDYALFLGGRSVLFVEAKALDVSLDDRKPLLQTLNYANAAGVDWCVLTNGAEWRIYKVHAQVAAEEKLFLTVRIGELDADFAMLSATLSLLSRDRIRAGAIDTFWSEWRMDREVEKILDTITGDEAFARLIAKRSQTMNAFEVRASLRRSGLRTNFPGIEAFIARLDGQPLAAAPPLVAAIGPAPVNTVVPAIAGMGSRALLMKTAEMVERRLLPIGTILTIKDRSDSAAKVVDGKRVEYQGTVMSFNEWGCKVTGWSTIQIYKWAVLPDGRLLEALREVSG